MTRDTDQIIYDSSALRVPFLYEISEFWRYRFLVRNLISRDLKMRYKRSTLGIIWAMANPLLTMTILVIVFTFAFRIEIENYAIHILTGLLLWNLFSQGSSRAMRSVLDNSVLMKKIYMPASAFVAAAIGSALINLLFALIPLIIISLATGLVPSLSWLLIPLPVIQVTIFTFGIGVILAALVVFFADILDIYAVINSAYFYFTPIIYPLAILPDIIKSLQRFNPLYYPISLFRSIILGNPTPDPFNLAISSIITLLVLIIGWAMFTRLSDQFAYRT